MKKEWLVGKKQGNLMLLSIYDPCIAGYFLYFIPILIWLRRNDIHRKYRSNSTARDPYLYGYMNWR